MLSLLASHRREINKERSTRGTGKGQDEVYSSKWFAYEALRFIKDKNQCKPTLSSSLPPKVNQETISQVEEVEDLECTATVDVEDEDNVMEADDIEQSQSASTSSREQFVQPSAPKRKRKTPPTGGTQVDRVVDMLERSLDRNDCDVFGELQLSTTSTIFCLTLTWAIFKCLLGISHQH
ncbi:uncharacterized protein LOC123317672 [Coccinella septempunctata]|uniref:uncharacterized protein LOC123317672 n=1 Tax=Coccinella septempunctata TaxID=41139 RepID=UPI001D06B1E2|nr:uncharacterized protein LOC123317672 [Coccinella septempunctata]